MTNGKQEVVRFFPACPYATNGELLEISLLLAAPPSDDSALPALPATAIVAECVEIIPAATAPAPADVTVAKTQTPVPTAPNAKPLSDAARDQAYFLYTTGGVVTGPATQPINAL